MQHVPRPLSIFLRWLALLVLLLALGGCAEALRREPSINPVTAVPALPPAPRSGPGTDALPADLPQTLAYVPPASQNRLCEDSLPASLPALGGFRSAPSSVDGTLCLYGFRLNRAPIEVALTAPDGTAVQDRFRVRSLGTGYYDVLGSSTREPSTLIPDGIAYEIDGVTIIALNLWLPVGMPAGEWSARAAADDVTAEGTFAIDPLQGVVVSTLPDSPLNPLLDRRCSAVQAGGAVQIAGTGFAPGEDVSLGVYYLSAFDPVSDRRDLTLVYGDVLAADALGQIAAPYAIAPTDPPGFYYAVTGPQIGAEGAVYPCVEVTP